jgi:putative transcriptional regulator
MATVKVTPTMIEEALRGVDWRRVDATTDEEIVGQVAADPDAAPLLSDAESTSARVRWVSKKTGFSQREYAEHYRVPIGTPRDWEHGRRKPDAAALAYLKVIEREPEAVRRALAA